MKFSKTTLMIVVGVLFTTSLPVLAAILLARQQGIDSERVLVLDLARSAMVQSDNTGHQLADAARVISSLTAEQACSLEGLEQMQRIDLGSTLLQGVGWMEGDVMRCSSFRGPQPMNLGPPDFQSGTGSLMRTDVKLFDPDATYLAIQTGRSVGIIHKQLALSFVDDVPGLAVGIFSWSKRAFLTARGDVPGELISGQIGGDQVFYYQGKVVGIVRSTEYDTGAIAILPAGHGVAYGWRAAKVLIPLGVGVGLILSFILISVVRNRTSFEMMIRSAVKRRKFFLVYQPVVELRTGRITGAEALIRWQRSEDQLVSPDEFIPEAEKSGLIPIITAHVLELLAEDAPEVLRIDPDFHFGINLSADDMHRPDMLPEVERLIERAKMRFDNLVIEATERSLVNVDAAMQTIRRFREAGAFVAIDDFGTGYSSLAYLARLEIDFLKIDKLFVQSIGTMSATSHVAGRIMDMAKDLNLRLVAEGIEREEQEQELRKLGVELGQGYLFGGPVQLEELLQLLRRERIAYAKAARFKSAMTRTADPAQPRAARRSRPRP